jgi:hypothetical protein
VEKDTLTPFSTFLNELATALYPNAVLGEVHQIAPTDP